MATGGTGALTFSQSSGILPTGLSLDTNTGDITGTPTAAGTFAFTVTATDSVGATATKSLSITINGPAAFTNVDNNSGNPFQFGTVGTVTFTTSGFPTPTFSNPIPLSGSFPGVTASLPLGSNFTFAKGTGALLGTATVKSKTTTPAGVYTFTMTASNTLGSVQQTYTLYVYRAPVITAYTLPTLAVGVPMVDKIIQTAGFPTAAITSTPLPAGLTLTDNGNGTATISGTPTATGSTSVTFTASNGFGTPATKTLTITVGQPPAFISANSTTATFGSALNFAVSATGFPNATFTKSASVPATDSITLVNNGNGTATLKTTSSTARGTYTFTITATNGIGTPAVQSFTLTVV